MKCVYSLNNPFSQTDTGQGSLTDSAYMDPDSAYMAPAVLTWPWLLFFVQISYNKLNFIQQKL